MTGVPADFILPFIGIDFDASLATAGASYMPFKALIVGQKLSGGSLAANTLQRIFKAEEVENYAGINSMAACMARIWFKNTQFVETYLILLDDDAAGTQGTRTITFTGPATEDGTVTLEINGERVTFSVANTDDATTIGDAFVAAVALKDKLPYSYANVTGTVTQTSANDGVAASDSDVRLGTEPTDQLPAGVGVTVGSITPGTNDPDAADARDAIGSMKFNVIVNPYADDTNLGIWEDYLEQQFGAMYMRDGLVYQAMRGSVSTQTTFSTGANRNCPHAVLIDGENRRVTMYELATAYAAAVAESAKADPGKPLMRIALKGIKPNVSSERWEDTERNTLAKNGIATLTDENGVQTEATVTMYLKNSAGAADIAYQYQNTLFILGYMRWIFVNQIATKYPRARLMDSVEDVEPGLQVMTPAIMRAEIMSWFWFMRGKGLAENPDQFKNDIVAKRSDSDPNRMEVIISPDIVNQLITVSGVMAFRL